MKTFYILYPGLPGPQDFQPKVAPALLTQQDLWQAARGATGLLFRVRSDSNLGDRFSEYDRIESCVGMVDSVTRWRSVFRHAGSALNAIHNAALSQACSQALQIVASQHPSAVSMVARRQMADNIAKVCDSPDVTAFAKMVAYAIAGVVMADSDHEAAMVVPFTHAFMPFSEEDHPEEFGARLATIETMAGATLLTEAASRLAERIPSWLYARMPEPLRVSRPVVGPPSDVERPSARPVVEDPDGEDTEQSDDGDKPDGL